MTTTTATKKMTKATFKSFVRKNRENLLIKTKSSFNGMTDGVENVEDIGFSKALNTDKDWGHDSDLGIHGIWLVGGGGDYFYPYTDGIQSGIEVSNCCGSYIVAVKD